MGQDWIIFSKQDIVPLSHEKLKQEHLKRLGAMEESSAAAKAYRFPRTRKMKLDENWLYFGGGLFTFSQVEALLMQRLAIGCSCSCSTPWLLNPAQSSDHI
jgi:hypothetical protein